MNNPKFDDGVIVGSPLTMAALTGIFDRRNYGISELMKPSGNDDHYFRLTESHLLEHKASPGKSSSVVRLNLDGRPSRRLAPPECSPPGIVPMAC